VRECPRIARGSCPVAHTDAPSCCEGKRLAPSRDEALAEIKQTCSLIIYLAGHGWSQAGRYYLLPYDFKVVRREDGSIDIPQSMTTAISEQKLEKALVGIDAANLVLILDTWYSMRCSRSHRR
jgi:ABC-type transport system involved in Fe-S cluster assembly fused permease/ATPase subunit